MCVGFAAPGEVGPDRAPTFFFFFFKSFFSFFFRQLLRLVASRHLEKMMTRNVEIGIGSVNETCGPSVLGSCMLEWLRRKVG